MIQPPLPVDDLEHVLVHTKPLWEPLRGQRIFVTGATGFFGTWLLETFAFINEKLALEAELVGLSRDPEAFYNKVPHLALCKAIRLHQGDVRDFSFPEGKFSHVIHAGTTSSAPVPPLEMVDTILLGTRRTLDFAVAAGVKKFLFVSSGAVYGELALGTKPVKETASTAPSPMNSSSAYGEGKRMAELLCALYHDRTGLETTIARCFALAGPHLPLEAHFAIGNFIHAALEKKPLVIKSDGSSERSYLYAADLAVWLWTILFKGQACHPYNVGSEARLSIKELAEQVKKTLGLEAAIQLGSGGMSTSYVPDTTRAQQELGLKERITLGESIQKHFDWIVMQSQQR